MPDFTLQITLPDGTSEVREFSVPKVAIGRGASDIVLTDPHASGRHGEFVMEGERLGYRDLESSNGSYTESGERIAGLIPVEPGTKIRIGKTVVEVRSVGREIAKTQLLGGTMLGAVKVAPAGKSSDPRQEEATPPSPYVESAPIEMPPWAENASGAPERRTAENAGGGRRPAAAPASADGGRAAVAAQAPRANDARAGSGAAAAPAQPGFFGRLFGRRAGASSTGASGAAAQASGPSAARSSSPAAAAGRPGAPPVDPPKSDGPGSRSESGGASSDTRAPDGGAKPAAQSGGSGGGFGGGFGGAMGKVSGLGGIKAGLAAAFNAATDGTPRMAPLLPAPGPLGPLAIQAIRDGIGELTGIVGHFKKLPKGWFQDVVASLKDAVKLVKGCWLQAGLVLGVLFIPNAILGWLATIIPFLWIVTLPVSLAISLLGILGFASLLLLMARAHLGHRTSAVLAWKAAIPGALNRWVALFVMALFAGIACILLIIPGAALGVFDMAACVLEGHGMIAANRRSLEIWKAGPVPLLVGALMLGIAMSVVLIPVGIVCGFIPFIGSLIGGLIGAAVSALGAALFAAYIVQRYFALRRALEGGDPEAAVRQVIG